MTLPNLISPHLTWPYHLTPPPPHSYFIPTPPSPNTPLHHPITLLLLLFLIFSSFFSLYVTLTYLPFLLMMSFFFLFNCNVSLPPHLLLLTQKDHRWNWLIVELLQRDGIGVELALTNLKINKELESVVDFTVLFFGIWDNSCGGQKNGHYLPNGLPRQVRRRGCKEELLRCCVNKF